MKSKNDKKQEYISAALRAGEDKLLHNPSRGEQVLCWTTVLLALMSLVMSVITAIMGGDAMTIARAFTEKPVWFALIALLTVYDRVFVLRGRSLITIVFCMLSIARDAFGIASSSGFSTVLAIISLTASVAAYGTLLVDQLHPSDHRLKYRVIYGGALLKLLVILISVIAQGSTLASSGTAEVLAVMARGATEIFVMLLMICHFDVSFGYFKFALNEITAPVDEASAADSAAAPITTPELEPEDAGEQAEYVPFEELEADKEEAAPEPVETEQGTESLIPDVVTAVAADEGESSTAESSDDAAADEVLDDFGYVPYDDDATDATVDSSVRPVTPVTEGDDVQPLRTDEEPLTIIEDGDVLVDDSVLEYERAEQAKAKAVEEANATSAAEPCNDEEGHETLAEPQPLSRAQQLWAQLTPIEQKYVSFALAHHKPEDTLQVEGLAGDLFDVWVNDEVICFQNDLDQASGGRGVRTAAIPFESVQSIGASRLDGKACIILTYVQDEETVDIGFTSASFGNFKRVMLEARA